MDTELTIFLYLMVDLLALLFIWIADSQPHTVSLNIEELRCDCTSNNHCVSLATIAIVCSFSCLFLLLSLRDYVGTDYSAYVSAYQSIGLDNLYEGERSWLMQSPSFFLLCKILYSVSDDYICMFAVIGMITLSCFYKAICNISVNWTLSLYLFLCFCLYYQAFNQIRQMTAIAIIAVSYRYLLSDDLKRFLMTVIVASSFHLSALIFLIIWPIRKIEINFKHLAIYFFAGALLFLFFTRIQNALSFLGYVQTYAADQSFSASFELSTILNFAVRLLLFTFCLLFYRATVKRSSYTAIYYNVAAVCTILQIGAIMFNIFGRLTTYFYIVYIFLIPEVLKTISKPFDKYGTALLYSGAIIIFAVYFVVYYFSPAGAQGAGYLNYSTWL